METSTSHNRREFLQRSALLTAGLALGGASVGRATAPARPSTSVLSAPKRKIGTLDVSALGLGCMSMAGVYNAPQPKAAMVKLIRQAVEHGLTFFDTAEVYGPFYSEEIVGEALAPFRNQVQIASKFGFRFQGDQVTGKDSSPPHLRRAVEGMLQRLKIETLDLCYLHRMDPNTPIEEIAGAVGDLIREGKVRNFGLSEVSPDTLRRAHAVQPVAALQSEYSMLERVMELDMIPLCEELGIAFVPWGPLCRGMLTGRFDKNYVPDAQYRRAGVPYFTPEALEANLNLVDLLKRWAAKKTSTSVPVTPAQIALAWLLAQTPFIVPIPGTTNPDHLLENIGAMGLTFTPAELQTLRTEIEQIPTVGFRAPASVFQDL
ncbi:Predicted oxidoreductase [Catalinimonas alkaloidigena]|uniref:Predicted oxidoreductase n=1 Tax=Catalinimonas alkaloidigena TaxID=1075417 RepID=A0A1G9VXT9_9BACT|nr:aldo/keto reductase [Catalinimonas alkaloidigena]SDM77054.1 Predicted oxidoreductase [Catalinimonas alkaloidigena]